MRLLGAGWGLGGRELRVGTNIMIFFFLLYTAASHTAHVLYIFCVYMCICIVSSYVCIIFLFTFGYFVFTYKMLESVVKCSEFVHLRIALYKSVTQ